MTDTTDSTVSESLDEAEIAEDDIPDATPESSDLESDQDDELFPRKVVEDLRQENGKYRQRAQKADTYARRLHEQMVRATGRLADPTDLEFNEDHLDDPDTLAAAVDDLLTRKPHLASRKPAGDIGQGNRGSAAASTGLLDLLKART